MKLFVVFFFALSLVRLEAGDASSNRPTLVLENSSARLVMDLAGGSLGEFRFLEREVNPFVEQAFPFSELARAKEWLAA